MTSPGKPKWLILLQVLAVLMMPVFFVAMVSTIAAVPREKALLKAKEPIPESWTWVVPNHGSYYPWPFHGPVAILFLAGLIGCAAFFVISERRWRRKKAGPPNPESRPGPASPGG